MLFDNNKSMQMMESSAKQALPSILTGVQINLVKASQLGLSLRQAVTFGIIQRLISLEAVGHCDIDQRRWWYIDGQTIHRFDPSNHITHHPADGDQHLIALMRSGLLDYSKINHAGGSRKAIAIKTNVVIWSES